MADSATAEPVEINEQIPHLGTTEVDRKIEKETNAQRHQRLGTLLANTPDGTALYIMEGWISDACGCSVFLFKITPEGKVEQLAWADFSAEISGYPPLKTPYGILSMDRSKGLGAHTVSGQLSF
ncbi:hypothetical protein ISS03_03710 [Patescibacteria group bacterium]|nr:hypothetical protein [Patescibacteria group bacterium]